MTRSWLRGGALLVAAVAFGWWAHGERVHAAPVEEMNYQFMSNNVNNALTVYSPSEKTLYVYQGVSSLGGSHVNCSYMLHMPSRAGGAIERENCKVGAGLP